MTPMEHMIMVTIKYRMCSPRKFSWMCTETDNISASAKLAPAKNKPAITVFWVHLKQKFFMRLRVLRSQKQEFSKSRAF